MVNHIGQSKYIQDCMECKSDKTVKTSLSNGEVRLES